MNQSVDASSAMAPPHQTPSMDTEEAMKMEELPASGHVLGKDDPDNPQNMPLCSKLYASAASFALGFVV